MNALIQSIALFFALFSSLYIAIECLLLYISVIGQQARKTNFLLSMFIMSLSWTLFFYFGN